ncbi:VOC family protein [Ethanoligenens harbinense]|uniref:Aldoketomutase n=1 Tax=Ethanoligenens harbinense (strain DSM 18485 / JCM 12961 / CGMCC 1.5033 / YUAN-3) TaxID=663278 RepID=E6U894_ETHHY|nr:VOC family protein [Ethanoligenens harbinense]ADU27113.1 Glyoxalase/bleomycin resistance protein/dioxygenase [Ethanoligenens harbinense YUAN-3]AVQ96188.1 lactoylglutathione lyase [Ethanoligenens harbinense YUAN-3]AYF38848.1 lactoylglutathione lyase [Ethanoligenens harbinense]AYF41598.1 lactoylglutathione lyase [Ethanoligenens harbinense]QCN92429.1 lactoylglutathione lyase [Ethanoligenens harbinense]
MQSRFLHTNINVTDLEKSVAFYGKALGLKEARRKTAADGSFILVYLGDGETDYLLELTWLRDHPQKYDLGENEWHIAFRVPDKAAAHALHTEMGCICYENHDMGLYFIEDPDGYWLEILG